MDTIIIWVGVLGFVLTLVFCCVVVALRQLTVMREGVTILQSQVSTLKEENRKFQKQGGLSSADTQQLLQQVDSQREETEELSTRVTVVEKDIKLATDQLEAVRTQAKKNSAKIDAGYVSGGGGNSPKDGDDGLPGGLKTNGSGSDGGGHGTGSKRDVGSIYEEILQNLKAQQSGIFQGGESGTFGSPGSRAGGTSQASFRGSPMHSSRHNNNFSSNASFSNAGGGGGGLSLELPQPLIVYQEISSGLYQGGQFRKFEHSVRIGDGTVGDLELVFVPLKGKRRIGGGGGGSDGGGGEELVFPLPDLREIKLDSDGTLPDGPSMKVFLTTRNPPTPQQLKMMGADCGGGGGGGGSSSSPSSSSIARRRKDAFATVEEVREMEEMTFVFQSSCSPLLDDWADFVTANCGDCVVYPAL